jgi:type IV pilus assembly protein PilB
MSTAHSGKKTIEELLLTKKILSEDQMEKAKNIQAQTLERLEDILMRMGFMTEKEVLELWSEFLGCSIVDITNIKVDQNILSLIPEYQAKQYRAVPLKKIGTKLNVVMADPFDILAMDMISFLTQCKLEISIAPKAQIELAIKQLYSWEGFSVAGEEALISGESGTEEGVEIVRRTSEEGPVVQFLNAIFKQAILKRASDIHVEPREDILLIRFRIDGVLHDAMTGPKSLLLPLISRIKILSHLDIAEKRLPQDGRLKVKMDAREVDFRVSTVPSLLGEKAVLRLLQREAAFELDNIGFIPEDLERLKSALDEPYGMVIVTGPTGAGKTTTLFGMLKYFSSSEINIFTIENPIEYRIDGITQVQINEKVGLTFAGGLRAALRQDPDVILVGEIRDLETAEIAFRAALTGHKVLSTLHTNNAPSTITRLIDMGVPAYLVNAAVRVIIAQKLLHRICPSCRVEYRPSQKVIQRLKLPPSKVAATRFFKGTGCKECNHTGAYGRLGVFETMVLNNTIRDIIIEGGNEGVLRRVAKLSGMKSMRDIAVGMAFDGKTTLEEILYVTPSDDEGSQLGLSSTAAARFSIPAPVPTYVMSADGSVPAGAAMVQPSALQGIDPNDPVFKSVMVGLEEDFLYFETEELAGRFQLPLGQITECLKIAGFERSREFFQRKFGKWPEEMTDDEAAELVRIAQEKNGRLPEFIFADEAAGKLFARIMAAGAYRALVERLSGPDKVPAEFTMQYCGESGIDQALTWAKGSRFALVDLVQPGRYKPWQFDETEAWLSSGDIRLRAKEALDWIMTVKLGCGKNELSQNLSSDFLKELGLGQLLAKFGNSVFAMTQAVYPGVFQPWQFPDEEAVIWFREDRLETAKAATQWLVESRLAMPVEDIPVKLSVREFHEHGLAKVLDLFEQNIYLAVENAYPGKFKPWQYAEPGDLWRAGNALEISRHATLWLVKEKLQWPEADAPFQLTRRHFLQHGLGMMLGILFHHSPFSAIENAFPTLKNDEIFQQAMMMFAQELRDIIQRWASMTEKIAINHFGKARFKVALPNLKIAPIVPENERIYFNAANRIEYVPQIIVPKISAYDDLTDVANWVPYCDRLIYWVLCDDRAAGHQPPAHPKVKLVFAESLVSSLRTKGQLDIVDKIHGMRNAFDRFLDKKAPHKHG